MIKSTPILKISVFIMGIPVIFVCVLGIIEFISKGPFNPNYALILYPIFIVQYIAAIPFYFGLYQAYKIYV